MMNGTILFHRALLLVLLLMITLGPAMLWAEDGAENQAEVSDVPKADPAASDGDVDLSVPLPETMGDGEGKTPTDAESKTEGEPNDAPAEAPLFEPVGRPWTPPPEENTVPVSEEPAPWDTAAEPPLTDEQWKEFREAELAAREDEEPNVIHPWQYPHPLLLPSPLALSYLSLGFDYGFQSATEINQLQDGTFTERDLTVTHMTLRPEVRYAVLPNTLELGGAVGFTFLQQDAPTWFTFSDFTFTTKYVVFNAEPFVVALGLDLTLGNLSYSQVFQPDYLHLNPYLTFGMYWKWLTLQPFVGFGYVADLQESNDMRTDPNTGYVLAIGDRYFPKRDMNAFYDDSPMRLDLGLMVAFAVDEQWYVGVETDNDVWLTPEVDPWCYAGPVFGYKSTEYSVRAGAMIPLTHQDEQFIFQPIFQLAMTF